MTNSSIPVTAEESYVALATTVRALGRTLSPALSARFEAPPGSHVGGPRGDLPADPTGETVLDLRRWQLSAAVADATTSMRLAEQQLRARVDELDELLATWHGETEETAP